MYKNQTLIFAFLGALLIPSCRNIILEDRTECPSYIFFRIVNEEAFAPYEAVHMSIFRYPDGLPLEKDTTSVQAIRNRSFYFNIRKAAAVQGCGLIGYVLAWIFLHIF